MKYLLLASTALLLLGSCAASHPVPTPPAAPVYDQAQVKRLDSLTLRGWTPLDLATLGVPAYLVPAPAGSSPRQRRQWQRAQAQNLAHAGVLPAKVKNSSVATAPGATAVNRPAAPVATAPHASATDNTKAGQRHGSAATAPHATASTKNGGVAWWWFLVVAVAGAVGWELLSTKVAPVRQLLPWRM